MLAGLFAPQFLPDGNASAPIRETESKKIGKKIELESDPAMWEDAVAPQAMLLRLAFGTLLVLGLIVVTLVAARPWLTQWNAKKSTGENLKLIETLPLGSRCFLHLVQVSQQQFLIGADGNGIQSVSPVAESFEQALREVPSATAEE